METGGFGNSGEVVRRCAAHKKSSDVDLERKICEHPGCEEQVEYGTETVAMTTRNLMRAARTMHTRIPCLGVRNAPLLARPPAPYRNM